MGSGHIWLAWLIGFASPAFAADAADPADADALAATDRVPGSSKAAIAIEEGIWAWVERFDGELLPEAAIEERDEAIDEALLVEELVIDGPYGLDVPDDYYDDPLNALEGDPLLLDLVDPSEFDIPIAINDHVKQWMRFFLGSGRRHTQRYLERKTRYEDMMIRELDAAGMPRDLIYVSMIESGFNAFAYSHAHASGLWQFISSTGRLYGLHVGYFVDERRDPEKATKAAIRYLADLHGMFDDWMLAWASYNTGPGRVRRAMKRATAWDENPDYWDLVEHDLLHRETQGYVPKIMAAAIIGKHPERYGFVDLDQAAPLTWDTVTVDGAYDVEMLAKLLDLSNDDFAMLNPGIKRYTSPDARTDVHVPVGKAEAFLAALADVPQEEQKLLVQHKVRSGETLSVIASKYGVSSRTLQAVNNISNPNRIYVGMRLTIPVQGGASRSTASSGASVASPTAVVSKAPTPAPAAVAPAVRPTTYRVRRGDTLYDIARRYGVTAAELQSWNGIGNASKLYVGQVLRLSSERSASTASSTPAAASSAPATEHVIAKGETLSTVADKHGVSVAELQSWNGISNPSRIYVGQTLKVVGSKAASAPAPAARPSSYTVRSGDTLSSIAAGLGVSVADLQSWNGIRNASAIRVGQTLATSGSASSGSASSSTASTRTVTHVVQRGEALSTIASTYGVSLSDLQSWNGIRNASSIYAGQKLQVRTSEAQWQVHAVRSGETLGVIAAKYGVSVSDLRAWNGLSGSTIYAGQKLRVKR